MVVSGWCDVGAWVVWGGAWCVGGVACGRCGGEWVVWVRGAWVVWGGAWCVGGVVCGRCGGEWVGWVRG